MIDYLSSLYAYYHYKGEMSTVRYQTAVHRIQEDLRQRIIETACGLYLKQGIEQVKMTDVAAAADVGVASLYRYFGTKRELVARAGIYVWSQIGEMLEGVFTGPYYHEKTGLEQSVMLLKLFLAAYQGHPEYLRFLRGFDLFMEKEKATQAELREYERSILDLQSLAVAAYQKGVEDGSVRGDFEFEPFYFTITHALLTLSQKLVCSGAMVESDTRVSGAQQLQTLIDMAIAYAHA